MPPKNIKINTHTINITKGTSTTIDSRELEAVSKGWVSVRESTHEIMRLRGVGDEDEDRNTKRKRSKEEEGCEGASKKQPKGEPMEEILLLIEELDNWYEKLKEDRKRKRKMNIDGARDIIEELCSRGQAAVARYDIGNMEMKMSLRQIVCEEIQEALKMGTTEAVPTVKTFADVTSKSNP